MAGARAWTGARHQWRDRANVAAAGSTTTAPPAPSPSSLLGRGGTLTPPFKAPWPLDEKPERAAVAAASTAGERPEY
jgi:hypothetical protein